MELPVELLATNSDRALNFFYTNLQDVISRDVRRRISEEETLYSSTVLAHYAQVSCESAQIDCAPVASCWSILMERYGYNTGIHREPGLMEEAGGQSMLLLGFLKQAIERHYNLSDCCRHGEFFFSQAAVGGRRSMMLTMANHYNLWVCLLWRMNRHIKEQKYLLQLRPPSS